MILRPSQLPRIMLCPASAEAGPFPLRSDSDASEQGTLLHAAIAAHINGKVVPKLDGENSWLFGRAVGMASDMGRWLRILAAEAPTSGTLGDHMVRGTMDALAEAELPELGMAHVVIDWKFGYKEAEGQAHQLMAYGWALCQARRLPVRTVIAWVRDGSLEIADYTPEQLDAWAIELKSRLASGAYQPGSACTYCPRASAGCAVRESWVQSSAAALVQFFPGELLPIEQLRKAWLMKDAVKKAIDQVEEAMKSQIELVGPVDLGDGRNLVLEQQERESVVLSPSVIKSLSIQLDQQPEDLMESIGATCSMSKLKDAISATAPRGQKGKTIEAALEGLREAEALKVTRFQQIKVVKS